MRVWFDILTPKQVMFFRRAVGILQKQGHEVLCTSRSYREAVELARIKGLPLTIVGRHGGADKYGKLVAGAERVKELAGVVDRFRPDAAVTFASPEGARVAFGLGIRHVGFNDSPHAEAVARLTVPLTSRLLCPWVIPYSAFTRYGIVRKGISRYRALDPAAWLKHDATAAPMPEAAKGGEGERVGKKAAVVLIRLEESKASYVADGRRASSALVDAAVDSLSQSAGVEITLLCRYSDQIEYAKERYGGRARIVEDVFDGVPLLRSADLFIGAGGTMSAEAALLGVPAISISPVSFYVQDYLVRSGLTARAREPGALVRIAKKMLADEKGREVGRRRAARLLASMEDPTDRMLQAITTGQDYNKAHN